MKPSFVDLPTIHWTWGEEKWFWKDGTSTINALYVTSINEVASGLGKAAYTEVHTVPQVTYHTQMSRLEVLAILMRGLDDA